MTQNDTPRCIVCEETHLARVDDAAPTQVVPVPRAALTGFPEGREGSGLTRRALLGAGLAGFASVYAPKVLGFEEIWEAAAAQAAPSVDKCLVVIYLAGGNDGLNLTLPGPGLASEYSAYQALRPKIGRLHGPGVGNVVGSFTLPGTSSELSMANVMVGGTASDTTGKAGRGLDVLWGSGDPANADATLALLPAVDYTPPNLSHFDSADHWFYGSLDKQPVGWLGRYIDLYGSTTNPLQAISLDTSLSKLIRTQKNPVCAIPNLDALGFDIDPGYGHPGGNPYNSKGKLYDVNPKISELAGNPTGAGNTHLDRARKQYGVAVDTYNTGKSLKPPANNGGNYPQNSYLAQQLRLAAVLLGANIGTRIITIHWGGFDTHSDQLRYQDPQIRELSLALHAFRDDLAARGVEQKVTTMCFSEFGRRGDENDGHGTDHGAGGLMMLSGTQVRGGQASEFPGVKDSELVDGNLKVTTDFRSVYESVITEWLGGDPANVLPGRPGGGFPALQRRDGTHTLFRP